MVRLRAHKALKAMQIQIRFNSYMVRLREWLLNVALTANPVFQFLYGKIKSGYVVCIGYTLSMFQFLYGKIKSFFQDTIAFFEESFNSYMVRLRVTTQISSIYCISVSIPIW